MKISNYIIFQRQIKKQTDLPDNRKISIINITYKTFLYNCLLDKV